MSPAVHNLDLDSVVLSFRIVHQTANVSNNSNLSKFLVYDFSGAIEESRVRGATVFIESSTVETSIEQAEPIA